MTGVQTCALPIYNVEVDPEEAMSEDKVCTETVDEIKKDLKSYLKSIFRLGK